MTLNSRESRGTRSILIPTDKNERRIWSKKKRSKVLPILAAGVSVLGVYHYKDRILQLVQDSPPREDAHPSEPVLVSTVSPSAKESSELDTETFVFPEYIPVSDKDFTVTDSVEEEPMEEVLPDEPEVGLSNINYLGHLQTLQINILEGEDISLKYKVIKVEEQYGIQFFSYKNEDSAETTSTSIELKDNGLYCSVQGTWFQNEKGQRLQLKNIGFSMGTNSIDTQAQLTISMAEFQDSLGKVITIQDIPGHRTAISNSASE